MPLIRGGLALGAAVGNALAADTLSITVMEIVDNAIILTVIAVAFVAAYPVNRWLIGSGKGYALVHGHH